MQGDHVGLCKKLIKFYIFHNVFESCIRIHIISQDPAAKTSQIFDDLGTDLTGSDNADSHTADFFALQTLQCEIIDLTSPE